MNALNQALLSKWIWQWSKQEEKLWKTIIKALYMQQSNALYESHFFKSQLKGTFLFCHCFMVRKIGDGSTINFWDEDWGEQILKERFRALYTFAWCKDISVKQVVCTQNIGSLFRRVTTHQAISELQILIQIVVQARMTASQGLLDDAIWKGQSTGMFSVKICVFFAKRWTSSKKSFA